MTRTELQQLFYIAWLGSQSYLTRPVVEKLEGLGLVQKVKNGYEATQAGMNALSPMARVACRRPKNYSNLTPEEQWDVDKSLGILDWDGL